jgi:NitT/TauT family transport system ATP-binding protein
MKPDHTVSTRTGSVQCRSVSKIWGAGTADELIAVDNVDLDVAPGEFVVMLGPSGCGKSTLLSMIAGLEQPTSGTIRADDAAVSGPGPDRCMIFQQSSLYPWMSVADNVGFGLKLRGASRAERRAVAERLLRVVGLRDVLDKHPDQLSGGMRQRVAIARALAVEPNVLLMDEPFAALDVQTRAKMQDFVSQVWREAGTSVIFVTHSIDEAIALADRVIVFTARPGRIKTVVPIDLDRPRDARSPEYHRLSDTLFGLLRDEVDRAFAQQESRV